MSTSRPDFFTANFALLKKHYLDLWQHFRDNPTQPTGKLITSLQGTPNLMVRKPDGEATTLHQADDPTVEIPQFLRIVPPGATGFVAFLGMGLGYSPLAFLKERPALNRMVIFELDEGIFWQALHAMDLGPLIKNPRVTLVVGPDPDIARSLAPFMAALTLESIHTLEHLGEFQLDRVGYMKLKDDFFRLANAMNVGGNTVTAYGSTFVENRFRQLSGIGHDYFLDALQDAFAGVPAILVAGGPSLNKNIHLLPQAKNKAVLIAVDAAIPPLLAREIKPDFVGSIDMQSITYDKYAEYAHSLGGVSLICAPWVTPKVPKYLQTDRVFWFFSQNIMENWLNSHLGGRLTFPGAGTVAQLNFFAAILMGCSPIIFVGQDFAFSEGQDHAANIVWSNSESVRQMMSQNTGLRYVPGTLGGTVATDRAFFSMKHAFEEIIRSNPNTYINATEGGAHIDGTRVMSLREVLSEFCQVGEESVGARIGEGIKQASSPDLAALIKEFRATLKIGQSQLKYITQSDELGGQILGELKKLERHSGPFICLERLPQGLQKRLRQNDELHGKLDRAGIWHLLQDVTTEGLRAAERMKVEIEQLQGDPAQYLLWLRKSIERVLAVNKVRRRVLTDFLGKISRTIDNFKKEQEIAGQNAPAGQLEMELARLYMTNGDIRLARPLLERRLAAQPDSGEIHFLLGKVAALQADFDAADRFFLEACSLAPALQEEIAAFRHACADEYLAFFPQRLATHKSAARKMLLKALRYDGRHEKVQQQVKETVQKDLALLVATLTEGDGRQGDHEQAENWQEAAGLAELWHQGLRDNPNLSPLLTAEQTAAIHFARGQVAFSQEAFNDALAGYQQAAELRPEDAQLQVAIFEAAFNAGRFDLAVAALSRAVALDRSLAGHWEELGDLLAPQRPADALAAYEQSFAAQPEQFHLLKKIGDCYLAMDQLSAAHEAYRQLKEKVG